MTWLLAHPRWLVVTDVCVLALDIALLVWPTVALGLLIGVLTGALVGAVLALIL